MDQACSCFEAARERDAEDLDIRALLGKCYLEQERFEEAKTVLEPVVADDVRHDYGQTQMALGEVYSRLGDFDAAIKAWQSVLEGNTYSQARVQLGEALLGQGKTAEAREQFEIVVGDGEHTPAFQRKKDKYWIRRARQLLSKTPEAGND